jgi:hypothetical protein
MGLAGAGPANQDGIALLGDEAAAGEKIGAPEIRAAGGARKAEKRQAERPARRMAA